MEPRKDVFYEAVNPEGWTWAEAFIKRPGMYLWPVTFPRVVAFIQGYLLGVWQTKVALFPRMNDVHYPPGIEYQFQEELREQGRLRWNRWDATLAAEVMNWDGEEPPDMNAMTEEQVTAALRAMKPLIERVLDEPKAVANLVRAEPVEQTSQRRKGCRAAELLAVENRDQVDWGAVKTYEVEVSREGAWWMITVPEVGYITQARDLAEVETMARSLIAGAEEVPADSFSLDIHFPSTSSPGEGLGAG